MAKELLKRDQVPVEFTWNLADMYPDIAAWRILIYAVSTVILSGCR